MSTVTSKASLILSAFTIALTAQASHAFQPSSVDALNCADYRAEKTEYSLAPLNPPRQQVQGVEFPGTSRTLFRGAYEANPQFNFPKVLRGLLGERSWYIGSPMFWGITTVLTKSKSLNDRFIPGGGLPHSLKDYFHARRILRDIETLLKCAPAEGYSNEMAEILAADLMNKVFQRMGDERVQDTYFDLDNPAYYRRDFKELGFGNNAVDLIISSTYDQVASLYGKKVLVLRDVRQRALDLGYWNLAHNGRFLDAWVDQGEINTPGYITADEVMGMQMRKIDRVRDGWGQSLPNSPVDYAIYSIRKAGRTIVMLLDGRNQLCILRGSDERYYGCENNWANLMRGVTPYPKISSEGLRNRIPLMGAFVLCDPGEACDVPADFWSWYGFTSQRALPAEVQNDVANMTVNGAKVVYLPAPPSTVELQSIRVISAWYQPSSGPVAGSDVTAKARAFLNGRSSASFKVTARYLGLPKTKQPREFIMTWSCSNTPKDVHTVTIPAPAEGQSFDLSCD